MKKLILGLFAFALVVSMNSCKKCGYCEYYSGGKSEKFCKDDLSVNEAACEATGSGKWVTE
jgi:hypothetical protein